MNLFFFKVLIICFVFLGFSTVFAETRGSAESMAIQNIKMAMEAFEKINDGTSATNWAQVGQYISLNELNDRLKKSATYPLQQRYVFLTQAIPMFDAEDGKAVLIRTEPWSNTVTMTEGRYIISRNAEGLRFNWYSENKIQQMLKDAGVKELPEPEPWNPAIDASSSVGTKPLHESKPSERHFTKDAPKPDAAHIPPSADSPSPQPQVAEFVSGKNWFPLIIVGLIGMGLVFFLFRKKRE